MEGYFKTLCQQYVGGFMQTSSCSEQRPIFICCRDGNETADGNIISSVMLRHVVFDCLNLKLE
jgi:hypothetical protein